MEAAVRSPIFRCCSGLSKTRVVRGLSIASAIDLGCCNKMDFKPPLLKMPCPEDSAWNKNWLEIFLPENYLSWYLGHFCFVS